MEILLNNSELELLDLHRKSMESVWSEQMYLQFYTIRFDIVE